MTKRHVSKLLNGAPLPNWVKLIVLGAVVGIAIGVNQASVAALTKAQDDTRNELIGIRQDLKDRVVTKIEFNLLVDRVNTIDRRTR